jgi:hypothetical protein
VYMLSLRCLLDVQVEVHTNSASKVLKDSEIEIWKKIIKILVKSAISEGWQIVHFI